MKFEEIIQLIDHFDNSTLGEISIKEGEAKIVLKKPSMAYSDIGRSAAGNIPFPGNGQISGQSVSDPQQAMNWNQGQTQASGSAAGQTAEASYGAGKEHSAAQSHEIINSPIVGTFYRSASPDSPPFVEEGDEVKEGETLCILEAMKVMNELEAEFNCRIIKVLAQNQDMVEYGTPLFEVERI